MPKTVPTADEWQKKYARRVAASGQDWIDGMNRASGIADAARSEQAEQLYAANVQAAIANRSRQKGLAGVTDEDIKAAARAVGPGGYSTPASAKAPKAGKKVAPFLDVIRSVLPTLPPKTSDAITNLTQRAGPIVAALQKKKREG